MSVTFGNFRNHAIGTAVSKLCFGPFQNSDCASLQYIRHQAEDDLYVHEDIIGAYGYDFETHLAFTKIVHKLSLDLPRVIFCNRPEFPDPEEFKDLRNILCQLRSFWHIEFLLKKPEGTFPSEDNVFQNEMTNSYTALIDRIRSIEDKLDDYTPPPKASITNLSMIRAPA